MKKITTHLWFDTQAREAAEFYTSLFDNSKVENITTLHDTPSGDCDIVTFQLAGQPFMAISAGPIFKFTPAISLHIKCKTIEEVDAIWKKLSKDGQVLMELGKYPFSEKYGWCNDKYGLSWQIMYVGESEIQQKITPVLMFVRDMCGKAEEAITFYTSVFKDGKINMVNRYGKGEGLSKEGTVKYGGFTLLGSEFGAMDSVGNHKFNFNEAISFVVTCATQEEIDYYWGKLSSDPESEQCGWLKDKYGVSWQIVPSIMEKIMTGKDEQKIARVTQAFLKMKKFDIAKLEAAADGK